MKYFKSIEHVHQSLIGQENLGLQGELLSPKKVQRSVRLSRDVMVRKLLNGELSDEEEEDEDQELELPKQIYPSNSKKRRLDINA